MTSERMAMADVWNKYANTAARKHGKPGRELRPKSLTLDMHSHVAVPRVAEIVTPHLKQATDPLVAASTPDTQALMAKSWAIDVFRSFVPKPKRSRLEGMYRIVK